MARVIFFKVALDFGLAPPLKQACHKIENGWKSANSRKPQVPHRQKLYFGYIGLEVQTTFHPLIDVVCLMISHGRKEEREHPVMTCITLS